MGPAERQAEQPSSPRRGRREFIRKGVVGGAAVWTAPTLISAVMAPAAASTLVGTLYGVDSGTRTLSVVDPLTGNWLSPALPTGAEPGEMTYHSGLGMVLGIGSASPQSLFDVDVATGAWAPIGALGDGPLNGIAYHSGKGVLYGCGDGAMFSVDPAGGAATRLGSVIGTPEPVAMAYDSNSDILYGVDGAFDALWVIDPDSRVWTQRGPTVVPNIAGLAYDHYDDVLYGCSTSTDSTYTIDRATGEAALLGATGDNNPVGLAFVP